MRISFLFCLMLFTTPALACSPAYDPRPLTVKLQQEHDFFIGRVDIVTDQQVTFTIITPGGPAKDLPAGSKMTFPRGEYGPCGSKQFVAGETWLYNGSDISMSNSLRLEPDDLKDGMAIDTVVAHAAKRLDPDFVQPHVPVKEDLPVPGTYTTQRSCGNDSRTATYTLHISEPEATSHQYTVSIDSGSCTEAPACTFSGQALAYGYGEIVVSLPASDAAGPAGCSLIVQQISAVDEWPKLTSGETRIRLNNPSCLPQLTGCNADAPIEADILKRTDPAR